jgi:hypothetical protein
MGLRWISIALFIILGGCVTSGGPGTAKEGSAFPNTRTHWLESNPFYKGRLDVFDAKTGMRTGTYLEPNPIFKGRMDVKTTGTWGRTGK